MDTQDEQDEERNDPEPHLSIRMRNPRQLPEPNQQQSDAIIVLSHPITVGGFWHLLCVCCPTMKVISRNPEILHISIVFFEPAVKVGIGTMRKNEECGCAEWAGQVPGRILQVFVEPVEDGVA